MSKGEEIETFPQSHAVPTLHVENTIPPPSYPPIHKE